MYSVFNSIVTKMIGMQDKMEQLLSDEKDLKQKIAEEISGKKKKKWWLIVQLFSDYSF